MFFILFVLRVCNNALIFFSFLFCFVPLCAPVPSGLSRPDGSYIRFDKNSCVVLGEDLKPRASRVLHPLPRELRNTIYSKLLFLSDVIL
jgi:hypothetical protein